MASFFEKLKKGMGVDEPANEEQDTEDEEIKEEKEIETEPEEEEVKEETEKPAPKKTRKPRKVKKQPAEFEVKALPAESPQEDKKEMKTSLIVEDETEDKEPKEKKWLSFGEEEEGQLMIDVYQTEDDLVIQAAVAGVKPENLDISIERDIVTIRGGRKKQYQDNGDYFIQECFWGPFSRQIILPVEVDPGRAKASFKDSMLTIRMPKIQREKKMKIDISS